jgi:hypothetical protein
LRQYIPKKRPLSTWPIRSLEWSKQN